MERRKFMVGLGSLAAGGAAAMSTGAFSSASADRDVNIDIENDTDALLGLESSGGDNTHYTSETSNGRLEININDGLNPGPNNILFLQLFGIRNNGERVVGVKVNWDPGPDTGGDWDGGSHDMQSTGWFVGNSHNANAPQGESLSGPINGYDWANPGDDLRILGPGQRVWAGVYFFNVNPDLVDTTQNWGIEVTAADEKSANANNM